MSCCCIWIFWLCVCCIWCSSRHHPHRTHELRSGSQDHHPSKNSVQKTVCCNSTSNAPYDGRSYPKHVELRIHQYNYLVASSWHFTLIHEEDVRSNNPHLSNRILQTRSVFSHVGQTMQYIVRFLVIVLQICIKLIDIRTEKETLFSWNSVVHFLVREELKAKKNVPMHNCGEPDSKKHVPIHMQQVQHLEPGDFSQTHSVEITGCVVKSF